MGVPWLQAAKQGNANFEGWKMIMVGCMLLTLSVSVVRLSDGCPVWFTWKVQLYVSVQFNGKSIWLQQLIMHSQNGTLEQKPGLMLSWSDSFILKLHWFWVCTVLSVPQGFWFITWNEGDIPTVDWWSEWYSWDKPWFRLFNCMWQHCCHNLFYL